MKTIHHIINYCIAAVWFVNNLLCKVMNIVPRHEMIVAKILGSTYSRTFTILIGLSEVIMAIWILTGIKTKFNAVIQMIIIAAMNILEFILVPDLLLWGKLNALFAFLFILLIYFNEFHLNPNYTNHHA